MQLTSDMELLLGGLDSVLRLYCYLFLKKFNIRTHLGQAAFAERTGGRVVERAVEAETTKGVATGRCHSFKQQPEQRKQINMNRL